MKKTFVASSLLNTILLTLTVLALSLYAVRLIAATSTTLGNLAESMQPGTWGAVPQTNIDAVLAHGSHAGNILPYAMSGKWDPTAHRLHFLGGDHGEPASWQVYYDEATNSWVDLGLTPFAAVHGYDHLAIDPTNRQLYFNPSGTDPDGFKLDRYPLASNGPWNFLSQYTPSGYLHGTHGVDWFDGPVSGAASGVLAIYNCGATGGEITIYDPAANRWIADITGFGGNSTDRCFLAYSKVHNVAILGGGNDNGRKVWRLNPDRTVTALPDAPVEVGIQRANVVADPVTGNFLIMGYGQLWEFDPRGAGTWRGQTGSRTPPAGVGNPGYPDINGVISAAVSNYGVVAYTTCRARSCNMYLYKHAAAPATGTPPPPPEKTPPTMAIAAADSGATVIALSSPSYGLEWPGDGSVRRMLYWHNPFPIYNATYVFKVYPRKKTTGTYRYYTTFFWGNDGRFDWQGSNANTYYGAHPYPVPAPSGPGQWEISVNSNDYVTGSEVQWGRWYTQAFRAWRESSSITHHEFYWDWPDTSKVISQTVVDTNWANQNPPTPAIVIGQAPDFNGVSWGGYPGWEEFNGIIRGIQIYSGLLSMADLQAEINAPQSTTAGQNLIWYLNTDPRPGDVTDKKATGTLHNPSWAGTTALEWTDQASSDTTPPSTPTNLTAAVVSSTQINLSWTASTDNVGVTGYSLERCPGSACTTFTQISTPGGTSYSDTGLTANTTYRYRVRATDAAGNLSSYSSIASATTPTLPDSTPPTISMTAPANGATVSGSITVSATASDNVGVVGVQFKLDGVNLGAEDTTSPYSLSWNTTTASNGSHTLSAVARDAAGNRTTSSAITVTVSNTPPPDTTPPTVSITSPANGATVSGTITATATASDNVGVVGVQYKLDGVNLGAEDTASPYSTSWNTTTASNGSHTLTAVARDAAGNNTTSTAVMVTVSNTAPDTTPPTVSVSSPANGSTVSATITVSATASDNVGVAGVQFKLDGVNLGTEDTVSPYSTSWNTTSASNGSHTLTAVARDAAGNSTTSTAVTVTVSNTGRTIEIQPGTNVFSTAAQGLMPGDTLIVHQGTYNETNRMSIQVQGTPTAPITITGAAGESRPLITRPGTATVQNTINIEGAATYLAIRGLEIVGNGGDGINMNGTHSFITLEDLVIHDIDVGINFKNTMNNITVRRNHIYNTGIGGGTGEGMYVGCNDATCIVSNSLIEQNWIHDSLPGTTQGDGIEVKVGSYSNIVRDNVIYNRGYPGIFVYGTGSNPVNIVEGNVVWNALEGIYAVADAIVRNNIVLNSGTGLSLYGHVQVAQMKNVTAVNNTLYNNDEGVYMRWSSTTSNLILANNAIYSPGKTALSLSGSVGTFARNYVEGGSDRALDGSAFINGGTSANAFVDPVNMDFWPKTGSLLIGTASGTYAPGLDFNADSRVSPFDVGAYETDGLTSNPGWRITQGFKNVSTPPTDTTPPTVSVTSPASGVTVSGTTTVSATASDNVGVAGVQFKLDGANLGAEDTASPYSTSWNTTTASNGSHTLTAVARDAAGNTTTSSAVTVTVSNTAPDTTPPAVSVSSPATGATVSATITVSATASDNVGVVGVQFKLDGANLGAEDTTSPYSVSWNTTTASNGSHTLTAVARDAAGNSTTSAAVTVTVSNTDTTPPTVSISSPANGATVSATITVSAAASDNVGVAGVQFKLDGVNLGAEDTTSPYSVSWNTATASNGSHTLTAVARDAAGNSTTSSAITVTVSNTSPDTTPPTVSVTSPATGSTVSATITVSAAASDNVGVAGVQFKLDGANLGAEDTASPYSVSWNTTAASNGSHTLTAVARDAAGNSTTSAAVTVTVSNTTPDTTPPTVSVTSPATGSTVSATITVSATASDNVGVAGVQFKLDGANLGAEDTASPYSVSWNTTTASNGSHTLTAVARDAAGNQTTSAAVTVTVAGAAAKWTGTGRINVTGGLGYFGFFITRAADGTLSGQFEYYFDAKGFDFDAPTMLTLTVTGNKAVITGTGQERLGNGSWSGPYNFTATVQDLGTSGRTDTFQIQISDPSATVAGSDTTTLIKGNIVKYY